MIKRILVVLLIGFHFYAQGQSAKDSLAYPSFCLGYTVSDMSTKFPTHTLSVDLNLIENVLLTTEVGYTLSTGARSNAANNFVNYRFLLGTEYIAIKRPKSFGYVGVYFSTLHARSVKRIFTNYVNFVREYNVIRSLTHAGIRSRVGHTWHNKYYAISIGYDYQLGLVREFSKNTRHRFDEDYFIEHKVDYAFTSFKKWNLFGRGYLHFNCAFPFYIEDFQILPKRKKAKKVKERNKRKKKRKRGRRRK